MLCNKSSLSEEWEFTKSTTGNARRDLSDHCGHSTSGLPRTVRVYACLSNHNLDWKWQPAPAFLPENSMDRGTWWAIIHRAAKSRTRLNAR